MSHTDGINPWCEFVDSVYCEMLFDHLQERVVKYTTDMRSASKKNSMNNVCREEGKMQALEDLRTWVSEQAKAEMRKEKSDAPGRSETRARLSIGAGPRV